MKSSAPSANLQVSQIPFKKRKMASPAAPRSKDPEYVAPTSSVAAAVRPPLDGTYILVIEHIGCMMLTVPMRVLISYEPHWPELLLSDQRHPEAAEVDYLHQGNLLAFAALRHLSRAATILEDTIRRALYLREGAPLQITVPDMSNAPITSLMVMKSLAKQLLEDRAHHGWESSRDSPRGARRALLLGEGSNRLRIHHHPDDYLGFRGASHYIVNVCIYPPREAHRSALPKKVHFPVPGPLSARKVVSMVYQVEEMEEYHEDAVPKEGERPPPQLRLWHGPEGADAENSEILFKRGVMLREDMFEWVDGRKVLDLVARWE